MYEIIGTLILVYLIYKVITSGKHKKPSIPVYEAQVHEALWTWLSRKENSRKQLEDWPGWYVNGGTIPTMKNWDPPCDYVEKLTQVKMGHGCENCPLYWPGDSCCGEHGLKSRWFNETDPYRRANLARLISTREIKPEVRR